MNMVAAAYIGVIIIWSTTPLAIKWSGEGVGFLFGVASRMSIGALICLCLLLVLKRRLPLDRKAIQLYLAGAIAAYGAMLSVYWGAVYIPSGWISVLFGTTPVMTSLIAHLWLKEESLSLHHLAGMLLAIAGLWVIFAQAGSQPGDMAKFGVGLVLLAAFLHSLSTVLVKRMDQQRSIPALTQTTGILLIIVPFFWISWALFGQDWPQQIQAHSLYSILYLGIMGSVVGFMLYYYVLQHVMASRIALITLLTPVTALLLGGWLNSEILTARIWWGTSLILLGLSLYQWGASLMRLLVVSKTR
ncbi:MAG: DMT family transporter [Gammaproteobacteria bacterium]|nr:DMT family transporter [Gammaproteobacteria bacterium]